MDTHELYVDPVIFPNGLSYSFRDKGAYVFPSGKSIACEVAMKSKHVLQNRLLKEIVDDVKIENKSFIGVTDPKKEESIQLFMCPITQDVLNDPVVASDGYTYSRSALKKWAITSVRNHGVPKSPFTRESLLTNDRGDLFVIPNRNVRLLIGALAHYDDQFRIANPPTETGFNFITLNHSLRRPRATQQIRRPQVVVNDPMNNITTRLRRVGLLDVPPIPPIGRGLAGPRSPRLRSRSRSPPRVPPGSPQRHNQRTSRVRLRPRSPQGSPPGSPPRTPPRRSPRSPNSFDSNGSPMVRSTQNRRLRAPPAPRIRR